METYFEQVFAKRLEKEHRQQFRILFQQAHPEVLTFSSLDFLNLMIHPSVRKKALNRFLQFGVGTLPSRSIPVLEEQETACEETLSTLLGFEKAKFFQPGNEIFPKLLRSLVSDEILVIQHKTFGHSPETHLNSKNLKIKYLDSDNLLQAKAFFEEIDTNNPPRILLLLESISSITGKIEPLTEIIEMSKPFTTTVVVDDSYAIGVWGERGMGLAVGRSDIDIVLGGFGKAFGYFGSYIASTNSMIDYLFTDIQDTTYKKLTPFLLGLLESILDLIPTMDVERKQMKILAGKLRKGLETTGFGKSSSDSHFVSIPFLSQAEMQQFNLYLADNRCIPNLMTHSIGSTWYTRFFINEYHRIGDINHLSEILNNSRQATLCEAL